MKKRLLFAYDCMMLGGTTTALLSLLDALDYERYDVDLILYRNTGEALDRLPPQVRVLPDAATPSRLPDTVRKLWRSLWNGQLVRAIYYMIRYAREPAKKCRMTLWQATERAHAAISRPLTEEYDAVIGYIESWGAHYAVSDRVRARRRIVWLHLDVDKSYFIPELDRGMYRRADTIVTVSSECRDHLVRHLPDCAGRIRFIENIMPSRTVLERAAQPVDLTPPADCLKLVSVCRIEYVHKGLDRGLEALHRLKEEGLLRNDLRWYWIGDGTDLPRAREYIDRHGLEDTVVLLGAKANPLPYVRQMDLFFLPSRFEGKPVAVTEAQILGLPCVVTRYASAVEQVCHGEDGCLLENTDEAVYEFLRGLCTGEYDAAIPQWKQGVREKDFSCTEIIKKTEELFL